MLSCRCQTCLSTYAQEDTVDGHKQNSVPCTPLGCITQEICKTAAVGMKLTEDLVGSEQLQTIPRHTCCAM